MDIVHIEENPKQQATLDPSENGPVAHSASQCHRVPPMLSRLDKAEWRRRLWHVFPGFLAFLPWFIPHKDPISPTLQLIVLTVTAGLGIGVFLRYRFIARINDTQRMEAVLGYAMAVLLTVLIFPAHLELGLTVLAVLAFGDGSATLVGRLLGGPSLPWNRQKTWSGMFAFFFVGGIMASVIYWGETYMNPETQNVSSSFSTALLCGMVTSLVAGVAESLHFRINDNIRVGLSATVTIAVMHGIMIGWSY
jgi:dolichol kinase